MKNNFIKKTKLKIDDKFATLDNKVNPKTGYKTWKLFSTINLIWIIVVLPLLVLIFGALLKPNTSVSFTFDEIQSQETTMVKNAKVSAGTQSTIGNIHVDSTEAILDTVFKTEYAVGTSTPTNSNATEITGAFTITSGNQEIIFDGVDGEEFSLYVVPQASGPGVDYSNYELIADNQTDITYDVTVVSDPSATLIELGEPIEAATFSLLNIDGSFINTEINLGIAIGIFSTWIALEIVWLVLRWYFGKWQTYIEVNGGEVND